MGWKPTDRSGKPHPAFRVANIRDLRDLEGGAYWSALHPYFTRSDYQRLRYSITGRAQGTLSRVETVSVRAASRAGELDVAYIADRLAATMSIKDPGLPDYCLTLIGQGRLVYSGAIKARLDIDASVGLVYRGRPGTELAADGLHERLAIWIPQASLMQRLGALLGTTVAGDTEFESRFDWTGGRSQALRHLMAFLMAELQASSPSILGSEAASRSFTDLFLYTLLRSVPHSHSTHIEKPVSAAAPGTLRRAEAYIRAHVEEPIAIHEVAVAAGCSLRSLQLAFRHFRNTTPLLAIRKARLEAAGEAMRSSGAEWVTITEVANRFGFANAGRFTRLYRAEFGETPAEVLRRRGA